MWIEIVNLAVLLVFGLLVLAAWATTGRAGRSIGVAVWLALLCALLSLRLSTIERVRVHAVNTNRSEPYSFAIGDSLEVQKTERQGLLDPFEIAVVRLRDGRTEVLANDNSLLWWKFNKQALQIELTPGVIYDLRLAGWYGLRNLIDVVQVVPLPAKSSPPAEVKSAPATL